MKRQTKIILSIPVGLLFLFVATLFYKTVCVMLILVIWRQDVRNSIPSKWRTWGLRGLWALLVLTLWIGMPRYRTGSHDRVRLLYIDDQGEPMRPPLIQYLLATLLPEREIVNAGLKLLPLTTPLLQGHSHLAGTLLRQAQDDMASGKIYNFFEPYDHLGGDNPMSGCYAQTFNDMLGTNYRVAFLCRPTHYDASKRYPLIVFCHGYLGNWQLYQGIWRDFDKAIVLSIGTRGMDGVFAQSHINEIFSFYLPMLERQGFQIDRSHIHLAGLSNGGTAIDAAMHSRHAADFESLTTISCNLGSSRRVACQVNFIGGGQDPSANKEPAECRQLKRMGVDADLYFPPDENHFVLVNRREEIMAFLKHRTNL